MFSLERWQEIFETIGKNKLRTFLTGVSVASGIFILVILLGIGEGMQNGVEVQFQRDAENKVSITGGITSMGYGGLNPGRNIQLVLDDFYTAVQNSDFEIEFQSPLYRVWSGLASYGNESGSYRLEGVYADYQFLEKASIIEGRYINPIDQELGTKNVVIGNRVKKDLFKDKSPIGEFITVSGVKFKVVGVFTDPGGERSETRIFMPLKTSQRIFGNGEDIRSISFTLPKVADYDLALFQSQEFVNKIERQLRSKYNISPLDNSALYISNNIENTKEIYTILNTMKLFFWGVGIATLFAGIIGVSNIMLIIVKERTKEIGIRKALGAVPMSIVGMVLHESIFVTAISGMFGLILGLLLLESVGPFIDTEFIVNPEVNFNVAVSTVIILIIAGAIAGFFPAWRGAKIKPIDALRDE
ncbi:MAG: ABC transporter permease [Flavobacteriaceae bacterium]|nr:ABC transporter permease [Flavobacteriaceae bacterium]